MATHVSGLAASIRAATESTTFDLANQTPSTIASTVQSAFSTPFPLSEMIRITFITGAGKLGRQKYDENAAKTVTSELRQLGFEDDRAASCVNECGGTFKLQHDTGKNLKTVVVFPNITGVAANGDDDGGGDGADADVESSAFVKGSIEEKLALSSPTVFEKMINSQCPSWIQKKECVTVLSSIVQQIQSLDEMLLKGQPLSDEDQTLYDAVSLDSLLEKESLLKKKMQEHVSTGHITASEKDTLLQQVSTRLSKINLEVDAAEKEMKPKKVQKLKTTLKTVAERQAMLENIEPRPPARLKKELDIEKLRKELRPLLKLEESAKGRLLTMKETKDLARKEEILEEIEELEEASRTWFETDEEFATRVEACRAMFAAKEAKYNKNKKPASASSSGRNAGFLPSKGKGTTTWATPGVKKSVVKKPKAKAGGGGVFAQMMMDSDSD
eukprot:CAMPEP_0172506972 /NCGR_PEP_ID=MMETSP1066-20121228/200106_1 /TAXON_ID=671091 /ORGANISM="Coscinodiscus wailesii, Strain CCMP2513" /LENGTH=442 /DNA_ID=CAMNT_0013284293 /DNA_START=60 /DNA_END=1388 /DNA_ORIENTATION=-